MLRDFGKHWHLLLADLEGAPCLLPFERDEPMLEPDLRQGREHVRAWVAAADGPLCAAPGTSQPPALRVVRDLELLLVVDQRQVDVHGHGVRSPLGSVASIDRSDVLFPVLVSIESVAEVSVVILLEECHLPAGVALGLCAPRIPKSDLFRPCRRVQQGQIGPIVRDPIGHGWWRHCPSLLCRGSLWSLL